MAYPTKSLYYEAASVKFLMAISDSFSRTTQTQRNKNIHAHILSKWKNRRLDTSNIRDLESTAQAIVGRFISAFPSTLIKYLSKPQRQIYLCIFSTHIFYKNRHGLKVDSVKWARSTADNAMSEIQDFAPTQYQCMCMGSCHAVSVW